MLQLRLLGEPILLGEPHQPGQPWRSHIALLAYLAIAAEGTVSRTTLAGMLWPEVPEATARRSLRQALFQMRRTVGEVVEASGDHVRLDPSRIAVDVRAFEQRLDCGDLREGLAVYTGKFLCGFSLGTTAFDQWADRQRDRLAARAAAAFEALSQRAAEEGRWVEALQWAERWSAHEPFSEPAAARTITLRAQVGDRGGALAGFEMFRARLRAELDLAPGPALEALARHIQRSPPAGLASAPASAAAPALPTAARLPLVGREAEFARLHRGWEAARTGARQFLLVTGEAGIGKTRLVQEFAGWVQLQGATVLRGRAYQLERGVPYSTLAGVLRGALAAPGLAGVDAGSLGELSRIVPEFATRFAGVGAPPATDLDTGRIRLREALRQLFENLAFEAPVVLLLDDLAWADESTLASLHYLWRTLDGGPLLVLATARSADTPEEGPLQQLLTSLVREAQTAVTRLTLEPLGVESIVRLAGEVGVALPDRSAAVSLHQETGGNPLFVAEALRARLEGSATTASPTVRVVIAERVAGLTPAARDLLRAAAVLGRRFPFPFAAALAALPHSQAIDALEELLARRLLQQVEFEYDFLHDVVRETVYEELGSERRLLLHRMALERLAPEADEEVGLERASRLAMHASRSGMRHEARAWLLRSAEFARKLFAGADADRFLEQALQMSETDAERGIVMEQIADVHYARSRFADAALGYHRVVPTTASGSTDRLRLRTKLLDASLRAGLLHLDDAADVIGHLAADAEEAGAAYQRDVLIVVATARLRTGRFAQAEEHAAGAVAAARSAEDPRPLVHALLLHAQAASFGQSSADALPILREAMLLAAGHGWEREFCDAETDYATELCRHGRWDEAIGSWSGVLERASRAGAMGALAVAHLNLADVLIRRGEWQRAESHLTQAEQLSNRFSFTHLAANVLVNRALLHWQRGEAAAAVTSAETALAHARAHRLAAAERNARALRVLGLLELDRVDDASWTMEALPGAEFAHSTWSDDGELASIARAHLAGRQGTTDLATRVLRDALEQARDSYARALLRLEMAELIRDQDPAEATRLADEAARCASRLGASPLYRRTLRLRPAVQT